MYYTRDNANNLIKQLNFCEVKDLSIKILIFVKEVV